MTTNEVSDDVSLVQILQSDIQLEDGRCVLGGTHLTVGSARAVGADGEVTADALQARAVLLNDL